MKVLGSGDGDFKFTSESYSVGFSPMLFKGAPVGGLSYSVGCYHGLTVRRALPSGELFSGGGVSASIIIVWPGPWVFVGAVRLARRGFLHYITSCHRPHTR